MNLVQVYPEVIGSKSMRSCQYLLFALSRVDLSVFCASFLLNNAYSIHSQRPAGRKRKTRNKSSLNL